MAELTSRTVAISDVSTILVVSVFNSNSIDYAILTTRMAVKTVSSIVAEIYHLDVAIST